jgi:DNA-binding transcriptional regulator YdaS (Cro superfamily)
MDLKTYLKQKDGKLSKEGSETRRLAEECGVTPYYLYMVALGHKKAGWLLCKAIERETSGVVRRRDLRPDIYGTMAA